MTKPGINKIHFLLDTLRKDEGIQKHFFLGNAYDVLKDNIVSQKQLSYVHYLFMNNKRTKLNNLLADLGLHLYKEGDPVYMMARNYRSCYSITEFMEKCDKEIKESFELLMGRKPKTQKELENVAFKWWEELVNGSIN